MRLSYEDAMKRSTLDERRKALDAYFDQPHMRLRMFWASIRGWVAEKIYPEGFGDCD